MKASGGEDLQVKGLTKEGVEEPVTVADHNSNNVSFLGFSRWLLLFRRWRPQHCFCRTAMFCLRAFLHVLTPYPRLGTK